MHATGREDLAWPAIEPYFDQALQLDEHSCALWLGELDASQPDVAKAVRALLEQRAALNAAGFLEGHAFAGVEKLAPGLREIAANHRNAGTLVGPYRLIREIGVGGMSSVWLAERSDGQLKREVALKLPLTGARMQVERFLRERDILAALTHPNIARLYDAGFSESGQPYLAMEYVAGTQLLQSCDDRLLDIRARLRLFVQALEAVQFAHAELVIHRDLKPSNILVTAEGRVVLLDFGIGKLLTAQTAQESELTQMSGNLFTPGYASPEQIAGAPLNTASDIYSLGVVLYELLTGVRPYRLKYDSRAALEQAILKVDPRRPSQSGFSPHVAAARGTSERALLRALKGDLDTIVLKALKRNPLERYASVSAFAQDIINHLHNVPVSARPDSLWYRMGRFTARYKVPVAAASVALLALLSGSAVAIWQARSAAVERDRAVALASQNEAVTDFLGRIIRDAAASSTPITVSELLTRAENLALNDTGGSPENRAAVLEMIADRYSSTDNVERAQPLLARALQLLDKSSDAALRSRLTCKHAAASAELGHAEPQLQIMYSEAARRGVDPRAAAECLLRTSIIHLAEARTPQGLHDAQLGLEKARAGGGGVVEAALLNSLAYAYHLSHRDVEANSHFEQALRKYQELGRGESDGALLVLNDWAISLFGAGVPRRALELLQQVERAEQRRGPDVEPTATSIGNRGLALQSLGRFAQARATFEEECRLAVSHSDEFSEMHCLSGLTSVLLHTSQLEQAEQQLQRFDRLIQESSLPPESPPSRVYAVLLGRLELARGRPAEAVAALDRALATSGSDTTALYALLWKSAAELAANHPAKAIEAARHGLEIARSLQGDLPYSNLTATASLELGRALLRSGDRAEARNAFSTALAHFSSTVDADHPHLLAARTELRDAQLLTARPARSEKDQQSAQR
jgi:serine/threonine protein kinase